MTTPRYISPSSSTNNRIVAPVNISTDLVNSMAIRATAALRMADHHLHARSDNLVPSQGAGVEMFCVSQTCVTFPEKDLKSKLEQLDNWETVGIMPVFSDMWVQALGRTSITMGHMITFRGHILASVTRVFVRQDMATGTLVEISEDERATLLHTPPPHNVTRLLPTIHKLIVPADHHDDMLESFVVQIGPQHCNNSHVDHAALADFVWQGLDIQNKYPLEMVELAVQYLTPASLHQTISCRVHKDRPLVGLYRAGTPPSLNSLLVLGQASVPEVPLFSSI